MKKKIFTNILVILVILQCALGALAYEYFTQVRDISMTGINAKTLGSVLIGTTENGTESFHPLWVVFKMSNGVGIITVPIISVGTNASAYNNVVPLTALTGMASGNSMLPVNIGSVINAIPPGTSIYANIATIAIGTTATVEIHVFGYYN